MWSLHRYGRTGCSLCNSTRLRGKCGRYPDCGTLFKPWHGYSAPFSNFCKGTIGVSGSPRRVLRMGRGGGIPPRRTQGRGCSRQWERLHEGVGARHKAKHKKEVEASAME